MAADPPKPPKSPRRKKLPEKTINTVLEELNKLIETQATVPDFSRLQDEINREKNERGAAILMATNTENALQYAISTVLQIRKGTRPQDFWS
jgi:hypothetical protein